MELRSINGSMAPSNTPSYTYTLFRRQSYSLRTLIFALEWINKTVYPYIYILYYIYHLR